MYPFQALSILFYQCGFNETLRILIRWPSYILMPMFSIFTYSTETIGHKKFLVCSTRWTLCNLFITLTGLVFGAWYSCRVTRYFDGVFLYVALPLMFFAIALYVIVITVESCYCACTCSSISITKKSGLDLDTLEVVFLEDAQPDPVIEIEMETFCKCKSYRHRRNSLP